MARLIELNHDSVARLRAVEFLIPTPLRSAIKAGPIEGEVWSLILENNAAAAKIRQILPALESHLRKSGWDINTIRIKIQIKT